MVNVVIGMAMGTACISPVLETGVATSLLTSDVFSEAGEAVITLVAVVEPEAAGVAWACASLPAQLLEMMVAMAGPGRMGLWPPVYSGFS